MDKAALVKEVKQALYASKICSYAQGLNIIKAKSNEMGWGIDMGGLSRIWKVCVKTSLPFGTCMLFCYRFCVDVPVQVLVLRSPLRSPNSVWTASPL